jgi:2,5-dihydroxypyridine 5,6-dioxygenase
MSNAFLDIAFTNAVSKGAHHLLAHCGGLNVGETVVIVSDPTTKAVGEVLAREAKAIGAKVVWLENTLLAMHGEEPNVDVASSMLRANLILGATSKSMAHTKARLAACNAGARYLSLPEYTLGLLADPCVAIDYKHAGLMAKRVADRFTSGCFARVTTTLGTDITLEFEGRVGNCCPGYVVLPGDLGSPPDIEANISPLETKSNGIVLVDGSIPFPGLGLLASPISLHVVDGRIAKIEGSDEIVHKLNELFDSDNPLKTRVLAECGVGLNPLAKLSGIMLTDEGAMGTMHFGFGSNATVGGKNSVAFHLDFVFKNPTLTIDGQVILNEGACVI